MSSDGTDRVEASSMVFDIWIGKASENIGEWGLQDEETILLAMQEELGELTQAYLEASYEGGDPSRVDKELDDLGALLLQLHEARKPRYVDTGTNQEDQYMGGKSTFPEVALGVWCDFWGESWARVAVLVVLMITLVSFVIFEVIR